MAVYILLYALLCFLLLYRRKKVVDFRETIREMCVDIGDLTIYNSLPSKAKMIFSLRPVWTYLTQQQINDLFKT